MFVMAGNEVQVGSATETHTASQAQRADAAVSMSANQHWPINTRRYTVL